MEERWLERWGGGDSWSEPARGKAACRLAYCLRPYLNMFCSVAPIRQIRI